MTQEQNENINKETEAILRKEQIRNTGEERKLVVAIGGGVG